MRFNKLDLLFIASILLICSSILQAQNNRPNVILILADDLGFECITSNGGESYKTPNVDKLAAQGMRFENCHALPVCTPSRVQIMTGQYNVRNYLHFGKLDRSQVSFGNLFKDAGYKTAIAGKWQLGKEKDSPQHFGFDESCLWQHRLTRTDADGHDTRFSNPTLETNGEAKQYRNGEYGPDIVSDFICDFIEENKNQPFFAYYPMLLTHCPFVPTPKSKDWDANHLGSLEYKGDTSYFSDMVSYMDMLVGKIVSKVDSLGLGDNTLIIFTGDNGTDQPVVSVLNGEKYPGGKLETTDNGTHVPLIARWPGVINSGSVCADLVDFSDFLPTMCDAAKISIPESIPVDGVSFWPQLNGKKGNPRDWIYTWYSVSGKPDELKIFARNKEYKLYSSGAFYNVKLDFFEENPIDLEVQNKQEHKVYKSLSKAIGAYEDIREIQQ